MNQELRERHRPEGSCPGSGDDGNGNEGEELARARRVRDAADKRIEKLLSGNSAAYVASSAQHGGQ